MSTPKRGDRVCYSGEGIVTSIITYRDDDGRERRLVDLNAEGRHVELPADAIIEVMLPTTPALGSVVYADGRRWSYHEGIFFPAAFTIDESGTASIGWIVTAPDYRVLYDGSTS